MIDDRAHAPVAPPTTQGEIGRRPAQWPGVVGIVGIVLAILGMLKGLWTAGSPLLFGALAGGYDAGAGDDPVSAELAAIDRLQWVSVVDGLLGVLVWMWGLVVFVGVLKRRRWSLRQMTAWAWVKIALGVLSVASGVVVQRLVMGAMTAAAAKATPGGAAGGGAFGANDPFMMMVVVVLGAVVSLVLACAWPVFLLIWSRRRSVREEVATW